MNKEERCVFIWEDKSTWINTNIDFISHYTHIRGYHCCRPLNIEPYYKNGLLMPSKKMLCERAINLLENEINTKKYIEKYFDEQWEKYKLMIDFIYFGICKKHLLDFCGHYLIYGSEIICGVAGRLDLQWKLKEQGIPTIFSVDVPISQIKNFDVSKLEAHIKENTKCKKLKNIDYTIWVNKPILSNLIVAHEHPQKIKDPLLNFTMYDYGNSK